VDEVGLVGQDELGWRFPHESAPFWKLGILILGRNYGGAPRFPVGAPALEEFSAAPWK
jgi:hypothetical protein